jgi:hypothetical protein
MAGFSRCPSTQSHAKLARAGGSRLVLHTTLDPSFSVASVQAPVSGFQFSAEKVQPNLPAAFYHRSLQS